jgi:CheY-like chemotaxis protein
MSYVLIVDDEPAITELFTKTLAGLGMQAGVAQNGSQALEMVSQQRPDLILLDLMMPEFSGAQVLAELQRDPDTSSIPVIVISAFARTEEAINLTGVVQVMQKGSFGTKELREAVTKVLHQDIV